MQVGKNRGQTTFYVNQASQRRVTAIKLRSFGVQNLFWAAAYQDKSGRLRIQPDP